MSQIFDSDADLARRRQDANRKMPQENNKNLIGGQSISGPCASKLKSSASKHAKQFSAHVPMATVLAGWRRCSGLAWKLLGELSFWPPDFAQVGARALRGWGLSINWELWIWNSLKLLRRGEKWGKWGDR